MGRKPLTNMLLQTFSQSWSGFYFRLEDDKSLYNLGALCVWFSDYSRFKDCHMLRQDAFDVERADAIARRRNYVIRTPDEGQASV